MQEGPVLSQSEALCMMLPQAFHSMDPVSIPYLISMQFSCNNFLKPCIEIHTVTAYNTVKAVKKIKDWVDEKAYRGSVSSIHQSINLKQTYNGFIKTNIDYPTRT